MNTIFQVPAFSDVKALLAENQLPCEDISASDMEHFFGCGDTRSPKGVVGLEKYGSDGLLRSLAVSSTVRGIGCGSDLVNHIEGYARSVGIENLYLLTNTAEDYFQEKGYSKIPRDMVADSVKCSREFSELCPENAAVMCKRITS